MYAIPNVVLPLVGGFLLDKIGTRRALILFTVMICLGQGLFMLGGYDENFWMMIIGRTIFGIGCENMYVGQSAIVAEWFINYELPLAISLISCIPLVGSFLNGAITPRVYIKTEKIDDGTQGNLGDSFRIGFFSCLVSLLLVFALTILDKRAQKYDAEKLEIFSKKR